METKAYFTLKQKGDDIILISDDQEKQIEFEKGSIKTKLSPKELNFVKQVINS